MDRAKGLLYQTRSTTHPRRLLWGRVRVGGIEAYIYSRSDPNTRGDNHEFIGFVLIWGDGPCQAVEKILLDNEVAWDESTGTAAKFNNRFWVTHKLGEPDQEALTFGQFDVPRIPGWKTTDRLLGICYSVVELYFDQEVYPNGVPNISAVVRGRNDIYDPRTGTSGYSTNVALCQNRYMTLPVMGPGLDYATKIGEDELIAAANACEQQVPISQDSGDTSTVGTEDRYTFNGVTELDKSAEEIIETFRTAMAGVNVHVGGKWRVYAGVPQVATFTIDKTMLVAPVKRRTRASKRDRFNVVRGVFVSEDNLWQPVDFPAYKVQDFIDADGEELAEDIELLNTNSFRMCRRLAKIYLYRSRYARQISVTCDIRAWQAQTGLPVIFDFPEMGFDEVQMDVLQMDLSIRNGEVQVVLELREVHADTYDWDPEVDNDTGGYEPVPPIPALDVPYNGDPPPSPTRYEDLLEIVPTFNAVLECRTKAVTAQLIGFSEFSDASIPPKKYLNKTLSGGGIGRIYDGTNNPCTDPGEIVCEHELEFSGTCSYNPTTGVLSNAGNEQSVSFFCEVQDNEGGDCTPGGTIVLSSPTVRTGQIQCCGTNPHCGVNLFPPRTSYKDIEYTETLTVEDTEENAINRALAAAEWSEWTPVTVLPGCEASYEARDDFDFAYTAAQGRLTISDLNPGFIYLVRVHISRTDHETDTTEEAQTLDFAPTADTNGEVQFEFDIPNEAGYDHFITEVELYVF